MGRDKAGVLVEGRPLWERQLEILRALKPRALFISGRPDGPYANAGMEILPDLSPGCGPLSGLQAALQRTTADWLVVLAIDLPAMQARFLAGLIDHALLQGVGVVPRIGEWFEPLAAVYPRRCLTLVEERLRGDDYSMQSFLQQSVSQNLITPWTVSGDEIALFRNVNTPTDLAGDERD